MTIGTGIAWRNDSPCEFTLPNEPSDYKTRIFRLGQRHIPLTPALSLGELGERGSRPPHLGDADVPNRLLDSVCE